MKSYTTEAMAAIRAGNAIVTGAVEILCDPPIRVWGGYGELTIDGEVFSPLGDRGLAQISGGAVGATAQNVTLTLSGVDQEALALLDASEVQQAPVTLWEVIVSGDGTTLLDAVVNQRGRIDSLPVENTVGGEATIKALVETAARGLGRSGGRMRTDADQRLVKSNDGFFRNVAHAGEKTLYWGGPRPANAGQVLGGDRRSTTLAAVSGFQGINLSNIRFF